MLLQMEANPASSEIKIKRIFAENSFIVKELSFKVLF
jgi:hypothetical protein